MRPSSLRVQRLVHVCNSTWSRALLPSVCLAERPACPSRAASSSAATVQKKRRQLPAVAAERGWLQEEEAVSPPEGSMQPRFDWTMRRYSKQNQAWSQFDSRTSERPPKRYKPNAVTVRRTDRFYGAIDAYRKRLVSMLFLYTLVLIALSQVQAPSPVRAGERRGGNNGAPSRMVPDALTGGRIQSSWGTGILAEGNAVRQACRLL